ncbi:MAG: prenyltransferase/squalene oxidase repeat-containing protein [Planctomycetota bacterium]|jgi:hypothetical protein
MRITGALLVTVLLALLAAPGASQERRTPKKKPKAEPEKPGDFFAGRQGWRGLKSGGGGKATQDAVDAGLRWLALHQDPKGLWDSDGFMAQCRLNQCSGAGYSLYDPGTTGLALLAFLGAGETHSVGMRKEKVRAGLLYLLNIQDPEGCIGPRTDHHFTYGHAIATLALAEIYGMTQDAFLRAPAQKAVDFIGKCQNPYLAWRYGKRPGDNDTSVSVWMVSALHSAKKAGLTVGPEGFDGMKAFIEKVTEPEYGRVGYTTRGNGPVRPVTMMDKYPPDKSESLTAGGIFCRVLIGQDPNKVEAIRKGVDLCLKALPVWDEESGAIDMYYWYWGTLSMFQVGGDPWATWNTSVRTALIDHQRKDGDEKGSWDPAGPWGPDGGRVYSTAVATLCLEVYYRYPRVFKPVATRRSGRRLR